MNKKLVFHTIGNILKIDGLFLILPIIISIIFNDGCHMAFMITALILFAVGFLLSLLIKPDKKDMRLIDGFVIVGLAWICICLFGTLPYILNGSIDNFADALFETVSGFTTTGATILNGGEIESLPKSILFYRQLTHFIGGIGVLVFVLALTPDEGAKSISLLKAETTGPQSGKLVPKVSSTAKILVLIYVGLTLIESLLLVFDPNIDYFDSICLSFSTASTGGFSNYASSTSFLTSYGQMVISVFMIIFGINFNLFYMMLVGKTFKVFKNEEFKAYLLFILIATLSITLNLFFSGYDSFLISLRDAFFETSSFITSTGLTNASYDVWPSFAKSLLIILMYIGACAGSTGGGLKVSRIVILFKSLFLEIRKIFHPNSVTTVKLDKEPLSDETVKGSLTYLITTIVLVSFGIIIVSFDNFDFETNFSAVSACINNLGVGFGDVLNSGSSFKDFGAVSKIVLSIEMLFGRLEIFPILLLFTPKIWAKN